MRVIKNEQANKPRGLKTNAEIINETYYEYHGKYEDGESIVALVERMKGVVIA